VAEALSDPDAQGQAAVCPTRGRLRIFLGAAPGAGKTHAMLQAAHELQAAGVEVVAGCVDGHGQPEIARLLERLESLQSEQPGARHPELDLAAALARRPAVLLVDDLARHGRRWQDVRELLAAGIQVWTTVNVQHLESLNDLVHQVTGVRERETVPDRVLEEADEIELIDLPPGDFLARLQAGKVHVPDGTRPLFRRQSLLALREIALRRMADRVGAASRAQASLRLPAGDNRVLVVVGPDDEAEQLVRAGKRIAETLDARWTVVQVETPRLLSMRTAHRPIDALQLAAGLGGEAVSLAAPSAAAALVEYARSRHFSRVIVGAPKRRGWRAWLLPATATRVVQRASGFDVVLIGQGQRAGARRGPAQAASDPPAGWQRYLWAAAVACLCTLLALAAYPQMDLPNIVMIYLAGATIAGLWLGRGPSACIALVNAVAFDFFFVPPRYAFGFGSVQYLITFGVMLCTALLISTLTDRVRRQTRIAGARERRTALLYAMSRELAASRGRDDMARVAVRHVAEVFQCQAVVLLPDAHGQLSLPHHPPLDASFRKPDLAVAQWVADHGSRAGLGCNTLPNARGLYIPLGSAAPAAGVLAVLPIRSGRVLPPEQGHLLDTFAAQIALALERARLAETAEASSLAAERESLRNTLLASISHDLRTPLSVIAGAASALSQQGGRIDESVRLDLARSIETKAREMAELVGNVLELMRWQSGQHDLRRDWQTVDDLIGAALRQLEDKLGSRGLELRLPADLPPVHVDAQLIVQLFVNLLDNVAKYTPEGSHVTIEASLDGDLVRIAVEDDGPGLPPGDPERLFEKFQRGKGEGPVTGVGLGLAICRAIVQAHGGEIAARHRQGGGACFTLTLPAREPA
jgi:two-component system sensor histidine kinase KdpD